MNHAFLLVINMQESPLGHPTDSNQSINFRLIPFNVESRSSKTCISLKDQPSAGDERPSKISESDYEPEIPSLGELRLEIRLIECKTPFNFS